MIQEIYLQNDELASSLGYQKVELAENLAYLIAKAPKRRCQREIH